MIPFQFHVTMMDLAVENVKKFADLCQVYNIKPLLIILPEGRYLQQPMYTKVIEDNDFAHALEAVQQINRDFEAQGFAIARIKAEVFSEDASLFPQQQTAVFSPYFECHWQIPINNMTAIEAICSGHDAHLSQNALAENEGVRYLTVREYTGKALFDQRVQGVMAALAANEIRMIKQKLEYCIFDSRLELDQGWAS